MRCEICKRDFETKDEDPWTHPQRSYAEHVFNEAKEKFEDLKNKSFGQDGFTPVCVECFNALIKDKPWISKFSG